MKQNGVVHNAKWIILCKVTQSLLQLMIGMLSARYLGPANYGLINYAKSVVAFVVPVTQLGLNATLVRELVEEPDKEGEILGTSLIMSLMSSLIGIVCTSSFVAVANSGERDTLLVCFLYSLSLFFQAIELIQYWFHYRLQSKTPSIVMLAAYVVVSLYKIFLLISSQSVAWFAAAYSIEYGITGLALLVIYFRQGEQRLSLTFTMAKKLFSRSRYYILSSLMVTLFQNTDHVMLKLMIGDAENGIYTAAVTCANVASFVYAAIIDSMRPVILQNKKRGTNAYEKSLSMLYGAIVYMSLLQGAVFTVFADTIVGILFGQAYVAASPVLRILIWYMSFSQMGRIRNIWILAEEKQGILWKINLAGAIINAGINLALIPILGAAGAALASLLTQVFVNFILGFMIESLRRNNTLLLRGINPSLLPEMLRVLMQKNRDGD